MKRFNIACPRKYTVNGEEKTYWGSVGTLTEFEAREDKPRGFALDLNMFPDTKFMVFEQKESGESTPASSQTLTAKQAVEYPEEDVNPDDIPF